MFWLGKFIGCVFGFVVAGPVGAVAGLFLGHFFDTSRSPHWYSSHSNQHAVQTIFFKNTFAVMGHIAKSDGRVSEDEIRTAQVIMQQMLLTQTLKQQAIHYFTEGKQSYFNLDSALDELINACHYQSHLLRIFIEIQCRAALSDGHLSENKRVILLRICQRLGFNFNEFFYGQHSYTPQQTLNQLEKAYQTLGVSHEVSNDNLKKAYRKLMSQNHPDKLVSKGLPEEMMKLATQKTQDIKFAYETICKSRNIL